MKSVINDQTDLLMSQKREKNKSTLTKRPKTPRRSRYHGNGLEIPPTILTCFSTRLHRVKAPPPSLVIALMAQTLSFFRWAVDIRESTRARVGRLHRCRVRRPQAVLAAIYVSVSRVQPNAQGALSHWPWGPGRAAVTRRCLSLKLDGRRVQERASSHEVASA